MRTLTGPGFAQAVHAATMVVLREQTMLDEINVFPVADADTGANLAATLSAASSRLGDNPPDGLGAAVRLAADAALDGARGNSGAIMAQFLHGLAEGIGNRVQVSTGEFAAAARRATELAYQALQDPREGTILSVLKAWATDLTDHAPRMEDFRDLLDKGLSTARSALANTPRQLEVLARNHVVDAGGQGFVFFLEGLSASVAGRASVGWQQIQSLTHRAHTRAARTDVDMSLRYCAEALLTGEGLERKAVKEAVLPLGQSVVVAGGGTRLRVHVHTNTPDVFFTVLEAFGTVAERKADDMIAQQLAAREATIALVSDSTCDLPEGLDHLLSLNRVPLSVTLGGDTLVDGVDITAEEFAARLVRTREMPRSSQPSIGDFLARYRELLETHEHIVSIHISSLLSGTYQAAQSAANQLAPERISVVDSRHTSVGLGMIVEAAGEAISQGVEPAEVVMAAREAMTQLRMYGTVQTLDYAVRGGRVDRRVAAVAGLVELKPIIVFNGDGRANVDGGQLGFRRAIKAVVKRAKEFAGESRVKLAVVHAADRDAGDMLAAAVRDVFGDVEIPVVPAGVVLTTHVGPGCVALAIRRLSSAQ